MTNLAAGGGITITKIRVWLLLSTHRFSNKSVYCDDPVHEEKNKGPNY